MIRDGQFSQDGFSVRLPSEALPATAPGSAPAFAPPPRLSFAENSDGSLTLLRCLDAGADDIHIEQEAGGQPVTAIAPHAFDGCRALVRVVLPASLRQIGEMAFLGCSRLRRLTIPGGVVRVGGLAFARCASLTHVVVEPGVAALGPSCFSKCAQLARVDLPSSVTSFGGGVFFGCARSLVLYGASGSAADAYARMNGLAFDAELWRNDPVFRFSEREDGSLLLEGLHTPQRRVLIPQELCGRRIAGIAPRAFLGDLVLEHVILGAGVEWIGESAFMGCTSLELAAFERGLREIGPSAFAGCTLLPQVVLPAGLQVVRRMAFFGCQRLTFAKLPPDARIEALAFEGCAPVLRVYGGIRADRV